MFDFEHKRMLKVELYFEEISKWVLAKKNFVYAKSINNQLGYKVKRFVRNNFAH